MGNTPITVGLRTEKTSYKAGESVKGTVYVSVTKQAQPAQAIMLRVSGREHSLVHYTTSETRREGQEDRTHTRDHYDESSCDFLQMEYPLHRFQTQQLLPGQYEFPFTIQLNHDLPSSMSCKQGQSHCSVEYILTATMVKPSSGIFSSNPSSEQKLNIFAAPPAGENLENTSLQLPVEEVPVNSCCCHYKGVMSLQAKFSKTTVQPRDSIDVNFRCQNQSTVKVDRVRVQLEQITEWNANRGNREVVKRVLDRREMDAAQFPELDKRHRRKHHHFGAAPEQQPFRGDSGWNRALIQVPPMIQDSYNGRCIKVRHLVSVHLLTSGCCTNDPDATTMVQVYHSLPATTYSPAEPFKDPTKVPSAPSSIYDEYSNTTATSDTPIHPPALPGHWDGDIMLATTTASPVGWEEAFSPSAPSEAYDDGTTPMAEAQVLPPDWNAQTAELVAIPMAEAMIVDSSWQESSQF